ARDEPPHSQRTLAVGSHRLRFRYYDGCLERRTVDSLKIQTNFLCAMQKLPKSSLSCGNSACLKTPQRGDYLTTLLGSLVPRQQTPNRCQKTQAQVLREAD